MLGLLDDLEAGMELWISNVRAVAPNIDLGPSLDLLRLVSPAAGHPQFPSCRARRRNWVYVQPPAEVMELMTLYPQPTRTQQNVEYLPSKRERPVPAGPPA